MATNWNAVLANINNASDILAILRKVLGLLDGKVDLTKIDEIIKDIENMQISVDTALSNVSSALSEFDEQAQEAIQQVIAAGLMEGFATEAELLATRPTVLKKYAKAEDTDVIWFWNRPVGTPDGNYWTSTGLSEYNRAINYINDLTRSVESNRAQNPNKFTIEQVNYTTAPTNVTGIATYPYRNGIKQLKLVSANTGSEIKAYWDFDAALFTREFSASVCIEGLNAGKDGLVGIQQLNASGSLIAEKYGLTTAKDAIAKQTIKINVAGIAAGATKIRLIVHMLTDDIREVYIHSPFIADGTNAEFLTPLIPPNLSSITGRVNFLDSAFDEVPVSDKNKFNPILAKDGYTIQYSNGTLSPRPDGIAFGIQAVQPGNTYTFWIPANSDFAFFPVIYTYAANGTYLGIDHSVGGSGELVNNQDGPIVQPYLDGNRTVTFTIPAGSRVAAIQMRLDYETHTAQQFDDLVNSMQLELGGNKTGFEPYPPSGGSTKLVLKESSLPEISIPTNESKETFVVVIDGLDAYIRTKFSSTLDLVQQVRYNSNDSWKNNVVNPWIIKTIPSSTSKEDTISAFSYGTFIATQQDDATPLHYNNTYIGANHGAFIVHQVVKAGHGKTYVDVGSKWNDGSRNYTLIRIVDANTLWFVSDNTGTSSAWVFFTTSLPAGTTFTHVSGATNTASIFSITSDTITQLLKALNNHSKKLIANGFKELTTTGVYNVESLEIIDSYDIMNVPALLSYLQSKVGTNTEQRFDVNTIASDIRVNVSYKYALNGSINVSTMIIAKQTVKWEWAGLMQALPLNYGGKNLLLYVPKINPITVGSNVWDLKNVADVSTTTNVINLLKSSWINPDDPPDCMVSIVKNGVNRELGQILGHSFTRGITKPALRKSSSEVGFFNGPTKKMYPHTQTGDTFPSGLMPAGTVLNAISYRVIFNSLVLPEATAYGWYLDNDAIYVFLAIHQNASMLKLPLPSMFNGKSATVVDPNPNFTLHSEIVSDGSLLSSVIGGYAHATIKLT
ncbi:hypothetical protein R4487_08585 [Acinetobacter baumannii]|nr:hypothetical protein [Acinetobacter baumannii]